MRRTYTMTQEQYDKILDACKPVPYIAIHCGTPSSPQENANRAWKALGDEVGFDGMTVEPVHGFGNEKTFTAEEKALAPTEKA